MVSSAHTPLREQLAQDLCSGQVRALSFAVSSGAQETAHLPLQLWSQQVPHTTLGGTGSWEEITREGPIQEQQLWPGLLSPLGVKAGLLQGG